MSSPNPNTSSSPSPSNNALAASAAGATFLILLQIGSRALTFALNQILLRFLSPTLLGAALQLEVFIITAHHFARESLRVACQRQQQSPSSSSSSAGGSKGSGVQAAINLSYVGVASGVLFALGLGEWFLYAGHPQVPFFREALRICEVAAVVELLSEPAFVVVQQRMLYKVRAKAEASAVVVKTLATAATVLGAHRRGMDLGVLPFAIGELAYCATLTVVYLWQTTSAVAAQREKREEKEDFSLLLRPIKNSSPNEYFFSTLSKPLVNLSLSLYVQSGIKYLLTQGDTFVSARFASLEDQGKYALAANYGGLIARMVLRPIEDSSRNLFARLCSTSPSPSTPSSTDKKSDKNGPNNNKAPPTDLTTASTILTSLLRLYTLLSLPLLALGPSLAPLLLTLIAGPRWSSTGAGAVLSTYIYSIPLLAINGVSEAFVAAAASPKELQRQSLWMGVFSAVFAGVTAVFLGPLGWGAKGLVAANCVNMGLRIAFNLEFAGRFFRESEGGKGRFEGRALLPTPVGLGAAAVVASVVRRTEGALGGRFGVVGEIARIGGLGGVLVVVLAFAERKFLIGLYRQVRSR